MDKLLTKSDPILKFVRIETFIMDNLWLNFYRDILNHIFKYCDAETIIIIGMISHDMKKTHSKIFS
jgi:hypothetical protein